MAAFELVLSIAAFLHLCSSHICMWEPMQRGNFSIDIPGSHVCYQKEGPCGLNDDNGYRTKIKSGSDFEIQFQQNLNHFYTGNPGYLDITFAIGNQPKEDDFNITLIKINDYNSMNEITQTNFSVNVKMPDIECSECVIRLRYQSNNPLENDRGTIFYQCSDISLTHSIDLNQKHQQQTVKKEAQNIYNSLPNSDCCGPKQFSTKFKHEIPSQNYESNGTIYYDEINQFMRMDVIIGKGNGITIYDGMFSMISNFSSGLEYYFNVNNNTCSLYGLDYWNSWCFGDTYNQSEVLISRNVACEYESKQNCKKWQNDGFFFEAFENSCIPASIQRKNGEIWVYYDAKVGALPNNTFIPNPVCTGDKATFVPCK